tara:strand:- start:739 stop:993 length:255 start_codon:yes stop_codon:yes gene_type:complete
MIKLVEIVSHHDQYHLREIIVNSTHIISMIADDQSAAVHASGKLPEGLHEAQQFSKITFTNGAQIVVVGSPDIIGAKAKNILHG